MFWKNKKQENYKENSKNDVTISLESYYLKGFDSGFKAAWDWMAPYMKEANEKLVDRLYQEAMNKALDQLEPTIKNRIEGMNLG